MQLQRKLRDQQLLDAEEEVALQREKVVEGEDVKHWPLTSCNDFSFSLFFKFILLVVMNTSRLTKKSHRVFLWFIARIY